MPLQDVFSQLAAPSFLEPDYNGEFGCPLPRNGKMAISLYSLYQNHLDSVACRFPNGLADFCLYRQLMRAVTHSHKRTRNGWPSILPLTLTRPRVPKNFTEAGQTTYVQPPLLELFRSFAVNIWFNNYSSCPSSGPGVDDLNLAHSRRRLEHHSNSDRQEGRPCSSPDRALESRY